MNKLKELYKMILDYFFYEPEFVTEVKEAKKQGLELGIANIQFHMKDGAAHDLQIKGDATPSVQGSELFINIITAEQKLFGYFDGLTGKRTKGYIDLLNDAKEGELTPVINSDLGNVIYKKVGDIKHIVVTFRKYTEDRTFRYKVTVQKEKK